MLWSDLKRPTTGGPLFYALSDVRMTHSDVFISYITNSGGLNILSENLLKFSSGVPLFLVDHTRSNTCVFLTLQQLRPSQSVWPPPSRFPHSVSMVLLLQHLLQLQLLCEPKVFDCRNSVKQARPSN